MIKRPIYLFIDDSNMWIEGMKAAALKRSGLSSQSGHYHNHHYQDYSWRVDIAAFLNLVEKRFKGQLKMRRFYGSKLPERLLNKCSELVECVSLKRSLSNGREKQVDASLMCDVIGVANALAYFRDEIEDSHQFELRVKHTSRNVNFLTQCASLEINPQRFNYDKFYESIRESVLVIVSGDKDFARCYERALTLGLRVEVMCWKDSISGDMDWMKPIHLDNHIDEIGFNQKFWQGTDSDIPYDRSIVLKDVKDYYEQAKEWLERMPVYSFLTSERHLVLIRSDVGQRQMSCDELTRFIYETRRFITSADPSSIISFAELKSSQAVQETGIPISKNNYSILRVDDDNDDDDNEDDHDSIDSGCDDLQIVPYTQVVDNKRQKSSSSKKVVFDTIIRCNYREYCRGLRSGKCTFGHTKEEKIYADLYQRPLRKIIECYKYYCLYNSRPGGCCFAHGEKDAFCPTCSKRGHFMDKCPHANEIFTTTTTTNFCNNCKIPAITTMATTTTTSDELQL